MGAGVRFDAIASRLALPHFGLKKNYSILTNLSHLMLSHISPSLFYFPTDCVSL